MRRGKQRWSALVSAPTSRLAAYMRDRLGDALWSDFVRHANRHYKARFVWAFCKPTLRCVGRLALGRNAPLVRKLRLQDQQQLRVRVILRDRGSGHPLRHSRLRESRPWG